MGLRAADKLAIREPDGDGPQQAFLAEAARRHRDDRHRRQRAARVRRPAARQAALLVYGPDGARIARYDKIHLFRFTHGNEDYDEARTISAGGEAGALDAPCGRVGLSICYDVRFPELYRALGDVALIVVPAAFTAPHRRGALGDAAARARDREPVLRARGRARRRASGRAPHVRPFDAGRSLGRDRRACTPKVRAWSSATSIPRASPTCEHGLPALAHRSLS